MKEPQFRYLWIGFWLGATASLVFVMCRQSGVAP